MMKKLQASVVAFFAHGPRRIARGTAPRVPWLGRAFDDPVRDRHKDGRVDRFLDPSVIGEGASLAGLKQMVELRKRSGRHSVVTRFLEGLGDPLQVFSVANL
jgi:hypothetical protein